MNPKDQLDNNELEQNQELPGKEFPETKDNEIVGDLGALEQEVKVNTIKEEEKYEEKKDTIDESKEEEERIKNEIVNSKKNKKGEYIPGHITDENNTLELANAGRINAAKGPKQLIQNGINTIEKTALGKRFSASRIGERIKKQLI